MAEDINEKKKTGNNYTKAELEELLQEQRKRHEESQQDYDDIKRMLISEIKSQRKVIYLVSALVVVLLFGLVFATIQNEEHKETMLDMSVDLNRYKELTDHYRESYARCSDMVINMSALQDETNNTLMICQRELNNQYRVLENFNDGNIPMLLERRPEVFQREDGMYMIWITGDGNE